MVGHVGQHRVEDGGGLLLYGVRLVGEGDGAEQREAVEDGGLAVLGMARVDRLHGAGEGGRAGGMVEPAALGIEGLQRLHVVALARGRGRGILRLLDLGQAARQVGRAGRRRGVRGRPHGMEERHRDAPVGHRARGIGGEDLAEGQLRLLVGEGVQESRGPAELRPGGGGAGDGEVDGAELLAGRDAVRVRRVRRGKRDLVRGAGHGGQRHEDRHVQEPPHLRARPPHGRPRGRGPGPGRPCLRTPC